MESHSPVEFLKTSEAARLCDVTRFTIRNWIVGGKLKASETAGRHKRILRSDLLRFMKETGIRPVKYSQSTATPLLCWEFHSLKFSKGHNCEQCLIFKERANRCFLMVREFGSNEVRCGQDCSDCEYMEIYFPKEKAVRVDSEAQRTKPLGEAALTKGFYKSGRYFAVLKNAFSKKK